MKAIKAFEFYEEIGDPLGFERDLARYLLDGYVISSPRGIVLTKPVRRDGGSPDKQWDVQAPDAWFVKFACGDVGISKFIEERPFDLPFVGWMRALKERPVRWWALSQLLRRK